jgi:hypothetical protein
MGSNTSYAVMMTTKGKNKAAGSEQKNFQRCPFITSSLDA